MKKLINKKLDDEKIVVKLITKLLMKKIEKKLIKKGQEFPQDIQEQFQKAIHTIFGSWNNPRVITHRNINDIPQIWNTGVYFVAMIFGNMGDISAAGVAFTRDPVT